MIENFVTIFTLDCLESVSNFFVTIEILLRVENFVTFITGDEIFVLRVQMSFVLIQAHFKAKRQPTHITFVLLLRVFQSSNIMPAQVLLKLKMSIAELALEWHLILVHRLRVSLQMGQPAATETALITVEPASFMLDDNVLFEKSFCARRKYALVTLEAFAIMDRCDMSSKRRLIERRVCTLVAMIFFHQRLRLI